MVVITIVGITGTQYLWWTGQNATTWPPVWNPPEIRELSRLYTNQKFANNTSIPENSVKIKMSFALHHIISWGPHLTSVIHFEDYRLFSIASVLRIRDKLPCVAWNSTFVHEIYEHGQQFDPKTSVEHPQEHVTASKEQMKDERNLYPTRTSQSIFKGWHAHFYISCCALFYERYSSMDRSCAKSVISVQFRAVPNTNQRIYPRHSAPYLQTFHRYSSEQLQLRCTKILSSNSHNASV